MQLKDNKEIHSFDAPLQDRQEVLCMFEVVFSCSLPLTGTGMFFFSPSLFMTEGSKKLKALFRVVFSSLEDSDFISF